jgi:hypothetical protein
MQGALYMKKYATAAKSPGKADRFVPRNDVFLCEVPFSSATSGLPFDKKNTQ